MSRYIDADALLKDLKEKLEIDSPMLNEVENKWINKGIRIAIKYVKRFPTVDVVEVRHGEWDIKAESYRMIDDDFDEQLYVVCPYCKRRFYVPYELDDEKILAYARKEYPYCHCGAKMDGERSGNELLK